MYRGDQMAFKKPGDICIAGFIDQDVQCFDTTSGTKTADYYSEIHAASVSPMIEPAGLAFDLDGRIYLTSLFGGQVVKEEVSGSSRSLVLLAALTSAPNQLGGDLLLRGPSCPSSPCLIGGDPASSTLSLHSLVQHGASDLQHSGPGLRDFRG